MGEWKRSIPRIALRIAAIFTGIFLVGILLGFIYLSYAGVFRPVDFTPLNDEREVSIIYDAEGERISEGCDQFCREVIPRERMGSFPRFAIAAEDQDFMRRRFLPIDLWGISRALLENLFAGETAQGASTLEQQLARTLFIPEERRREREEKTSKAKWLRKFREIRVAFALRDKFSPEEILDLYLNNIYCGESRSGVQACSQWYFRKDPSALTIDETAMIIATWRSPRVSPFFNAEQARRARSRVLTQLLHEGVIKEEERALADAEPVPARRPGLAQYAPNFVEYVRRTIVARQHFIDQGLRIHTSLDPRLQVWTNIALEDSMDAMKARNPEIASDLCGAAIVVDAKTGAIKVWTQISPATNSEYDLVYQAKRHPGSAFKAFLYVLMVGEKGWRTGPLDAGTGPYEVYDSSSILVPMGGGRGPHAIANFPYKSMPRFLGRVDVLTALAHSRNAAAMSVMQGARGSGVPEAYRISKEELLQFSADLGVASAEEALKALSSGDPTAIARWDPGLTAPLGSIDVSLYEMVRAWTAFRTGTLVEPYAIERVEGPSGHTYQHENSPRREFFDETTTLAIVRLLRAPVERPHGTAQSIRDKAKPVFFPGDVMGKTGTSSDDDRNATDNWFLGCTPTYCMGVWIGRNTRLPLPMSIDPVSHDEIYETGGRNALPVFAKTMQAIYGEKGYEYFPDLTDPDDPFPFPLSRQIP